MYHYCYVLIKNLLSLCLLLVVGSAAAQLVPNGLFSNNMVLQRNMPVPVWGQANAGEKITVDFAGQKLHTTAINGKWMVTLQPMKERSLPLTMTIKAAKETVTIENVLIGEVWLCAGQSNMEWALFKTNGGDEAIANSTNNQLRIFNIPHNVQMQPVSTVSAKWLPSDPKVTKNISAVGYYFLSNLQKKLQVPVGFINAAFGGTKIEAWLSRETLAQQPVKDKYMDPDWMKREYDSLLAKAQPLIAAYEKAKDSAKQLQLPIPPKPAAIPGEYKGTTTIYNGEVNPIIPFAIKGIAWYQGESNAYPQIAGTYQQLLTALIGSWRNNWKKPTLPFIVIQLSGDGKKEQVNPVELSGKALLKEAQLKVVQAIPNTVLVTTSDCGELDVHYLEKRPIGQRVCNAALALAYGQPTEYTGPLYQSYTIAGNAIVVSFTHADGGLMVQTDSLKPATLYGFAIAGSDKKFYWADAEIKGNKVVVSSKDVPNPVAVRYAWADFSYKWNLFNKAGYPASSFRTDVEESFTK